MAEGWRRSPQLEQFCSVPAVLGFASESKLHRRKCLPSG